jgi:xylulose-5-phosphate/fructose-6-phosphate phosphoketolase
MEMLSEHTLLGWLEGYLLTGRHGFFHTYEAFAHVIDSMFNQHAKWLDISQEPRAVARPGRVREHPAVVDRLAAGPQRVLAPGSRLHRSRRPTRPSVVARLPAARRQHAAVGRRSLPAQHRLHQRHRRRQAEAPAVHDDRRGDRHCAKGIGIWPRASTDAGEEPDVVLASLRRRRDDGGAGRRGASCASGCPI